MSTVEVAGLRIGYARAGQGPPLVLLHGGFGIDSRQWRPQLEGLSDDFTVVAWDAPGHGRSSDPPEGFGLADYADCLAGFIDALELRRPHVCGLSFGGGLAIQLFGRHPKAVRSLILAGAYAGWGGSLPPEVVRERLHRALRDADRPPHEWVPDYLPGMFSDAAPQALVDELLGLMLEVRPAAMRIGLRAFADADLRDVLPRIDVPTLLLYGELDERSPLPIGRALHEAIPTSRFVELPGVGHVSNLEAPDLFNQHVRDFLRPIEA